MSYTADITVVLDRSGSMSSIRDDTIGGFNTFLKDQKAEEGEDRLTLVQFDDVRETIYEATTLSEVEPLTEKTFVPRNSTALLDTLGFTITKTGERLGAMDKKDRPEKVIFVIITDGKENASKEFAGEQGRRQVFDMIKHQTDKYNWQFLYIGANQDAIGVGQSLGISGAHSMSYASSGAGTRGAWKGFSASVSRTKRGFAPDFTPKERRDSMAIDTKSEDTAD